MWTAVSYQLKDRLQLSPSASQFVFSVAFFPWSIKPLYGYDSSCLRVFNIKQANIGSESNNDIFFSFHFFFFNFGRIISDCIPIGGKKRTPYLVISTVLSLVPWLLLGLDSTSRSSSLYLMIFLTVQNLGSAMADVVIDAMIAEAVRIEK